MTMDKKLRSQVLERDKWCWVCGLPNPDTAAVHHRKLRSQGGEDSLTNLIALCHACHNLATNSVHLNPGKSYDKGLLVHSWDDPADVPITQPDGATVYLLKDGGYEIHTQRRPSWA